MTGALSTYLTIESLQIELTLEEKKELIELDVQFFYPRMPLACASDEKKDATSYKKCLEIIQAIAAKKSYTVIEHLVYEIHTALKKEFPIQLEILVRVRRMDPKFPEIKKGISFTFFPQKEQGEKKPSRVWDED